MKPIEFKLNDTGELAEIELQQKGDKAAIEYLLDLSFGPGRFNKTAYRLRDHVDPIPELCLVARMDGRLVGTLRFWPIMIKKPLDAPDGTPALLLGPIAVQPDLKGKGVGIALMKNGMDRARELGHQIVILVGDPNYYCRVGFSQVKPGLLTMPGPVDIERLMIRELVGGAMDKVSGYITSVASISTTPVE